VILKLTKDDSQVDRSKEREREGGTRREREGRRGGEKESDRWRERADTSRSAWLSQSIWTVQLGETGLQS